MMQAAYQRLIANEPKLVLCGMAGSAAKALSQIVALQPDIVIVDVSLKDMDGLALTKTLIQSDKNLRVVVVSGHESAALEKEALRLGAKAYLPKRKIHQFLTLVNTVCAE